MRSPSSRSETAKLDASDVANTSALLQNRFNPSHSGHVSLDRLLYDSIVGRTENPYYLASFDAAAMVAVFGAASFRTIYKHSRELASLSESDRRRKMLNALRDKVKQNADGRVGRPVWASNAAAAYLTLTGDKCWNEREEELMAEDGMTLIQAYLDHQPIDVDDDKRHLDNAAWPAADYKIITGNSSWDDEVNRDMANAALDAAQSSWEQEPSAWGLPVAGISHRIARARILMASNIVMVQGDPNRGIDLIF